MKFSCDSRPLAYALNKCTRLARPNSTYPVTRNVLLEANAMGLTVSATDQVFASVTFNVDDVSVEESGSVLVDAGSLAVFISALGAQMTAHITKADRFLVKSGTKKISLRQVNSELVMPDERDKTELLTVSGSILIGLMSTSFMCMDNDPTAAMGGVYFLAADDHLYSMAASLGRVAYSRIKSEHASRGSFLLPKQTASMLSYFLYDDDSVDISTTHNGTRLLFETGRFSLSSSQLAGNYPNKRIAEMVAIPRISHANVDLAEFEQALKTCSEMVQVEDKVQKRINFHANLPYRILTITTLEDNELGDMEWPLMIKDSGGQSFKFSLHTEFLDDVLQAISKLSKTDMYLDLPGMREEIYIGFGKENDTLGPIFLSASGVDTVFMLGTLPDAQLVEDDDDQ